jgi:hypothetical protein
LRYFSQNITTLTSLKCSNMFSISSTDLFLIADCFPLLQELDLSNPAKLIHKNNFSDGVETLSLTLSKLQKINLSRHRYMNNRLVICLFNNCKFLHEAIVFNFDCLRIIDDDIVRAICARPALTSLDLCLWVSPITCSALLQWKVSLWPSLSSVIAPAILMMESFVCYPSVHLFNIWIFNILAFWTINNMSCSVVFVSWSFDIYKP